VYLIGAGGCGMSGLGHLLLDLGCRVLGSDLALNQDIEELRARGAEIFIGHRAEQVTAAAPILVVYSSAIRSGNPELRAAEEMQVPVVRRAVLLAALVHRQRGLCVAGMHGKTTTTALLTYVLEKLNASPSYAIGARTPQFARAARFVDGSRGERGAGTPREPAGGDACATEPWFAVEADESDGTLTQFHPHGAIVLNVDEEHLDFYTNLESVCCEFEIFGRQTSGPLIFCADDARLSRLFARHPQAFSYGFHALAQYRIELKAGQKAALSANANSNCFEIWHKGACLGQFSTLLLGEKNISNAAAVIALLHQLGFDLSAVGDAVASFRGVCRRQEELFHDSRFRVIDDYGHHPAEIQATIAALKSLRPRRLLVAFQPHRFTRTHYLLEQFATCFTGADQLWVSEVYSANEQEIAGASGQRLAQAIGDKGQAVEFVSTLPELRRAVRAAMMPGDLVLFLGAGDITQAARELAAELRKEPMAPTEVLVARLTERLSAESIIRADEPLAKRTTLRVGGQADLYVEPATEADLSQVLKFCAEQSLPFVILGRGSNLLIRDGGVRGMVICLARPHFSRIEVSGERLLCGAGAKLKLAAVEARRHGLAGLEFLEGIPGSIGGALRMNAGAMGSWMFETVESIRFMDFAGNAHEQKASEVYVEYRGCPLFKTHIALSAVLKGQAAPLETIAERMNRFSAKRWESQPAAPSAGCIFKNPTTVPAGKLIDELGLKGTRVGGAIVSDVHGNFIVNEGKATARDVLNLIALIQQRAKSARGIDLQTEVEIIGEDLPAQN
jgi:UDP-N-acetylenolpyruvoylglucosamine reductase